MFSIPRDIRSCRVPWLAAAFLTAMSPSLAAAQGGQEPLDRIPTGAAASPTMNRLVDAPDPRADAIAYVRFVASLIDPFWSAAFKAAGVPYTTPRILLTEEDVETACGNVPVGGGPLYCDGDRTMVVQPSFFSKVFRGQQMTPGDFAPAYVIAHEWGHHVQNLFGLSAYRRHLIQGVSASTARAVGINYELQADCFAGTWARYAYGQRRLNQGDVQEAQTSATRVGSDYLGTPVGEWTHGSSAQRLEWFNFGFLTGDPSRCKLYPPQQTTEGRPPARTATFAIGQYEVSVPPGSTAQMNQNGLLWLAQTQAGITAHIRAQRIDYGVASPAPAINFVGAAMRQWNLQQPLLPVGQAMPLDRAVQHIGGSAAVQRYEQEYQSGQSRPAVIHGLFTLVIRSDGQAVAIDVFSNGSARGARDWGLLDNYLAPVLSGLRNNSRTD